MAKDKKSSIQSITNLIVAITGLLTILVTIYQLIQPSGESNPIKNEPITLGRPEKAEFQKVDRTEVRPDLKIIHVGESYWVKEGYRLNMDKDYEIIPYDLNNKGTGIRLTNQNNEIVLEDKLMIGKWIVFKNNNFVYKITLIKIERAGKNPFKKAAFFKVEKGSLSQH